MNFELLIFDWDGTVMDSEARIISCVAAAVRDLGKPVPDTESISNIIGLGLKEAVNQLFPDADDELHLQIAARYRVHFFSDDEAPSQLFDGARETLQELSDRGHMLAVATGKGRQGLDYALETTGLGDLFHLTRCADETFSKPHPEMLNQILELSGMDSHQALMIGDTEYDMEMARNAGMSCLGVTYGVHAVDRLRKHNPLDCIDDIAEIPKWLDRYPKS
ncbi:MAG: HAD family hydrolase [gamma proteobacterium symbiont of Stewartia floridana]|nr:HAD-IA family hydrolase [Candidatus Thiodiazotropha taylori]RLW54877.1 MAG: HAD family hydrolase [gamma proteobacterium symbiont of Stewartia floridana]RLW60657.1 MAG: HAD family hydrolase [gamma proteobacterium symbiont of Stewartia floridana]RLW61535.1 MAG: HAD family hydrolase [gamma proteobacterium symbiont of Stewartia floridana]